MIRFSRLAPYLLVGAIVGFGIPFIWKTIVLDPVYMPEILEYNSENLTGFTRIKGGQAPNAESCIVTAFAMATTIVSNNQVDYYCCINPQKINQDSNEDSARILRTSSLEQEKFHSSQKMKQPLLSSLSNDTLGCEDSINMTCNWIKGLDISSRKPGSVVCTDPQTDKSFTRAFPD
ncbi:hypothetical protein OAL10_02310 [Gammaproteobacteria bacterium]|nr:hypothetical protein [Gammaproteobacteria bacterium]